MLISIYFLCRVQLLPETFADYLRMNGYIYLILCTDSGVHCFFEVFLKDNPSKVKLGFEWKEFCLSNGFNAWDYIRFKFSVTNPYKRCQVFKLT